MVAVDLGAARTSYEAEGQWTSPVLFTPAEITRFLDATERVVAGRHRSGRAPMLCLPSEPGPHDLRKIDNAWWADPDLAALATDARLGEIAAALLGASSVRLWQDQLLYKPPGGPSETTIGWHQDWASWDTVASHAAFVTAWVAFDDVDDDNGAMQIIRASHTWGLVPGASNFFGTDRDAQLARLGDSPAARAQDYARTVESRSIVMRAGQVSFHHPLTFHGSGPNTSDRMRRSLAIHFVDAEVSAVSEPGIWQHYNLALFLEHGGLLGERYRFDDLCPTVFAQ
jgi:ectoine hydroxylase-related dioxygenase (phytanoyl-CoA dioxygenase family)